MENNIAQVKLNLLQMALRIFEIELQRGKMEVEFKTIYQDLLDELLGQPKDIKAEK